MAWGFESPLPHATYSRSTSAAAGGSGAPKSPPITADPKAPAARSSPCRSGVTPPSAEWGLMLNNMRQAIWVDPVIAALPGVMIFITSMCFNLLSDGLRQAMDVRL